MASEKHCDVEQNVTAARVAHFGIALNFMPPTLHLGLTARVAAAAMGCSAAAEALVSVKRGTCEHFRIRTGEEGLGFTACLDWTC